MEFLTDGILALTWQQIVMFAVGITLIWLAIKKGFEPALLLPMGFGAILVNLPFSGAMLSVSVIIFLAGDNIIFINLIP